MSDDGRTRREADAATPGSPDPRKAIKSARPLSILHDVTYLGGYVPVTTILVGQRYDLGFLEDRLEIVAHRQPDVLAVLPYRNIEDVNVGGPGLVSSGGEFVGGGFGVTGAVEGMAVASVLNGLTSRTSVKTIVRIQGTNCELFLLNTRLTPDGLRMELSRPLSAIRTARPAAAQRGVTAVPGSPVEELAKLADLLEKGLLTREEFDLMKAKLLAP